MSRFILHAIRSLSLTSPVPSSSTTTATQRRHKSNRPRVPSLRPKSVYTSSGLLVPPVQSITEIQYSTFISRLKELNPKVPGITQRQADEALDIAKKGAVPAKLRRQAKRAGRGRTKEGDTVRFEADRLARESQEYWRQERRMADGTKVAESERRGVRPVGKRTPRSGRRC
jgi:hypothetical protein